MTEHELKKILSKHTRWLNGDGGEQAILSCAHLNNVILNDAKLQYAKLQFANLNGADLQRANLRGADLTEVKLYGADLLDADLNNAELFNADLSNAKLRSADLQYAQLQGANLRRANLRNANLRYADLTDADLKFADLTNADLQYAELTDANLNGANLSGAKGILSQEELLRIYFERDNDGYIAYKTFGSFRKSPENWVIEPGSILCENVNFNRTQDCGCGINVAPLEWVKKNTNADGDIWRVRIRWEWLSGVCVPYMSDGKIRCEKVELIEKVKR